MDDSHYAKSQRIDQLTTKLTQATEEAAHWRGYFATARNTLSKIAGTCMDLPARQKALDALKACPIEGTEYGAALSKQGSME